MQGYDAISFVLIQTKRAFINDKISFLTAKWSLKQKDHLIFDTAKIDDNHRLALAITHSGNPYRICWKESY